MPPTPAAAFLGQEARALLTRLSQVRPFVANETMVPAAMPSPAALYAVDRYLLDGRRALHGQVRGYLEWLHGAGAAMPPSEQQRRFTVIRLVFNDVLAQLDLFTEAVTQRSEHRTGVWLSGMDMLATDALRLPGDFFDGPPVMCYLARGPGAAIRRVRTRLPGGGENPVALIRVPRERMIGHGIASSLVHEVGHQAAALLSLVESLRPALLAEQRALPRVRSAWICWDRWISEVIADVWAVSKLGIGATLGLVGVVSLPRWFVFRHGGEDPHPIPWIRVLLSCAVGDALYPDPQWMELADLWTDLYPARHAPTAMRRPLYHLRDQIPALVRLLLEHKPPLLRGARLGDVLFLPDRRRIALLESFTSWRAAPAKFAHAPPAAAFAVVGQARAAGLLSPEQESRLLGELLTGWAIRSSLDTSLLRGRQSVHLAELGVIS